MVVFLEVNINLTMSGTFYNLGLRLISSDIFAVLKIKMDEYTNG